MKILDLFCGAGGASVGYSLCGFEVVGVDIRPQPHYPFEFVQEDALGLLENELRAHDVSWLDQFSAIHASPPCQLFSTATKRNRTESRHHNLITPLRELLRRTGKPYVIENVVGAPLENPVMVCGTERGLSVDGYRLKRHRMFELGFDDLGHVWPQCACPGDRRPIIDVTGGGPTFFKRRDGAGGRPYKGTAAQKRVVMEMPWATRDECNEAIPPRYTELIGNQLMYSILRSQHA